MRKSLEDMCLDSVIQNFDQLMVVYSSSSSIIPTRCFEFLQRLYSKTLIDRLSKTDRLRDQYVPFLINPYLKQLDLTSDSFSKIDVIIEQLKLVGSHITSLDVREKYFREEIIVELITLVPNVEALYVSQTESSDNVLKCVAKHCPLLNTLDVGFCSITTEGLKQLCEKDENGDIKENHILRKLHINATTIGDDGVAFALSHFPALEELDHENVGGTIFKVHQAHFVKDTLDSLKKYNLRKLSIQTYHVSFNLGMGFTEQSQERPAIKEVLKVCSVLCPQVSCLSIDNVITQDDMLLCSQFPKLKNIKLCSSTTDLIDYAPFLRASGQSLIEVDLDCGILSVELLGRCCPKLEKLMLQSINFEKVDEDTIKSKPAIFSHLKFLMCEGMDLIEESAESVSFVISSSPVLEILHLRYCRNAGDTFVTQILESKCLAVLKELDLSYSDTSSSTVRSIVAVTPVLEKLIIEDCDIADTEYQELRDVLRSENRSVEIIWRNGSTDYESDYDNDYPFFHEYEFRNYDLDYINDYDEYDDDLEYVGIDSDIDYYDVDDFM